MSSAQYETYDLQALCGLAEGSSVIFPDLKAQLHLGLSYALGTDVGKDELEASHWFRLAADGGHARAQRNLAFAHLQGRGIPRNQAQGIRRLRFAADWGDAPAQRQMGYHYTQNLNITKDERAPV